jgi:hypothetical protein
MTMKSSSHRPGGGIASRVNKQVNQRLGSGSHSKNPGRVGQIGIKQGDHTTDDGAHGYRGEPWKIGPSFQPTQFGNANAAEMANGKGGVGKGRTIYGCGTQGMQGRPDPGNAPSKSHDILGDFGADYRGRGSR